MVLTLIKKGANVLSIRYICSSDEIYYLVDVIMPESTKYSKYNNNVVGKVGHYTEADKKEIAKYLINGAGKIGNEPKAMSFFNNSIQMLKDNQLNNKTTPKTDLRNPQLPQIDKEGTTQQFNRNNETALQLMSSLDQTLKKQRII